VLLPYSIQEGIANFRRAKFAVFASTSAISVALVLLGVFAVTAYYVQNVTSALREQAGEMEVFIETDASGPDEEALHARIETMPGVARTEFISQEEAYEIFRREFGEDASIFEDPTFLPTSVKVWVRPQYANPDSMETLAQTFGEWRSVSDVVFNRDVLASLARNRQTVSVVGGVLSLIVILAAIFLIANTIRLTIYARRLLIRTMKLVGATDPFVRRPFLVEGVLQGFAGATVASALVWGGYRLLLNQFNLSGAGLTLELSLVGGLYVVGILLGWFGAFFAARRFIKSVELH